MTAPPTHAGSGIRSAEQERFKGGAYVAGGTRGIGRAIAAQLVRGGYQVSVCGSTEESVADCFGWMEEQSLAFDVEQVDVRDAAALDASIQRAEAVAGRMTAVVYAVGRPVAGSAETLSPSEWDACLDINLRCAFFCIRSALPSLRRAGGGSIVLISSIWARTTPRNRAAYVTAKTAMSGLVRAAALDHACDNIRVNAVAPGFVDTELLRGSIARAGGDVEREIARIIDCHPLGRLVSTQDVADTTAFLLSEQASGITGQTIYVDGGMSIRLSMSDEVPLG